MIPRISRIAGLILAAGCALSLMGALPGQPGQGGPHTSPTPQPAAPAKAPDKPANSVTIEVHEGVRVITSNGIPDHETGAFPGRNNPNAIRAQKYAFRVPENPIANQKPTPVGMRPFGVALNGVVFDPGTAEWLHDDPSSGWHMEAIGGPRNLGLDQTNAHVQPTGAYHYHAIPTALLKKLAAAPGEGGQPDPRGEKRMILVGWAADGFPIYGPYAYAKADDPTGEIKKLRASYTLKAGDRAGPPSGPGGKHDGGYEQDWEYTPGSGDLDECGGRSGVTPEFPGGTYYYVLTDNYPYIPRMFRGTPDHSFDRGPRPGRPGGPGGPGRGPRGDRSPPPRD